MSLLGTPVAPPPPQTGQQPAFIVIHGPGHDYDDHFEHQHQHHAAVAHGMSWVVWLVIVLAVSLGGSGVGFYRCSHHSALISGLVWDGSEPLVCGGNENIAVSGVEATFTGGSAIVASGNCHVKCTDCKITAPTAVEAGGNAQVTLVNGTIKGTNILGDASGNARITITGNATVAGRNKESANGKVSAPTPPPLPVTAAPPPTALPTTTVPKPAAVGVAKPSAPAAAKPKPTPSPAKSGTQPAR